MFQKDERRILRWPMGARGMNMKVDPYFVPLGEWAWLSNAELSNGRLIFGSKSRKIMIHSWVTASVAFDNELQLEGILDHLSVPYQDYLTPKYNTRRYLFGNQHTYYSYVYNINGIVNFSVITRSLSYTATVTYGSKTVTIAGDVVSAIDINDHFKVVADDETYNIDNVALNGGNTDLTLTTAYAGSNGSVASLVYKTRKAEIYTMEKGYPLLFSNGTNTYVIFFGYGKVPEKWTVETGTTIPTGSLLGGTPPNAYYAMTLNDYVIAARTSGREADVFWSSYLNPESWDISGSQYVTIGDWSETIIGMCQLQKGVGAIFSGSSIYSINWVGGNTVWEIKKQSSTSVLCGGSIAADNRLGVAFYLSRNGLRVFDGYNDLMVQEFSPDILTKFIKGTYPGTSSAGFMLNTSYQPQIRAYCLPDRGEYILLSPCGGLSLLIYDYVKKQIKHLELNIGNRFSIEEFYDADDTASPPCYNIYGGSDFNDPYGFFRHEHYYLRDMLIRSGDAEFTSEAVTGWFHPAQDEKEKRLKFNLFRAIITYDPRMRSQKDTSLKLTVSYMLDGVTYTKEAEFILLYDANSSQAEATADLSLVADKIQLRFYNENDYENILYDCLLEWQQLETSL